MKWRYILILVVVIIQVGCSGKVDTKELDTKEMQDETKTSNSSVDLDSGSELIATSSNPYYAVRLPNVADYSFMKTKMLSLEKARTWGDAYDLRQADLSDMDLSNEIDNLSNLVFDTATIWPDKLPEDFDPTLIMEIGKNPGLGIRDLHEKGITGKGINIAILDYTLLVDHEEYCNQIKLYDEVNNSGLAEMHGSFVASLSVGKSSGVAPDAGLYFIGASNVTTVNNERVLDFTDYAASINKIVEINNSLPKEEKIRAISISAAWCPDNKGYKEMNEAVEQAKKEGIFVISCNLFETYGFWTYSLEKDSYSNPDDANSFKPYSWDKWIEMQSNIDGFIPYYEEAFANNFQGEMLLVPIGSRTTASPTGQNEYCFYSDGGWSAMEPYLAGLYALACQVNPDVTPDLFWKTALEIGELKEILKDNQKYSAKMMNPNKLIEKLQN
ncbi:MAG: hypothetical protein ACERKZ_01980 [Lachnotalea sp.]